MIDALIALCAIGALIGVWIYIARPGRIERSDRSHPNPKMASSVRSCPECRYFDPDHHPACPLS